MTRPAADSAETTPLLSGGGQLLQEDNGAATEQPTLTTSPPKRRAWSRFQVTNPSTIVLILAVVKFLVTLSGMMILVPLFRLLEDAFCHRYYNDDSRDMIPEKKCKVDAIQRELAYLSGWSAMVSAVISLIVAMPYGILADRIGRRPTFLLSYTGIVCAFVYGPCVIWFARTLNLYILLSGSLWFLLGGGIIVAMSVLYAMAADVSGESDRGASFLYLAFGASAGGLGGPLIAGLLMEKFGPWVPILTVYCFGPIVYILILIIPETLKIEKGDAPKEDEPLLQAMRSHIASGAAELLSSLSMLKNPNILLSMAGFFIQNPLVVAYSNTLAQYVSVNFGWTLAQTSYLLSPLSLLHLAIMALIPKLSEILVAPNRGFRMSAFVRDLRLAQASFAFIALAGLFEGFGQSIVVFLIGLAVGTFGCASSPLTRAVVTAHVDAKHTSRLYALLSIVETVGSLFGGPVLAFCFDVGMRNRGLWIGLPWFYVALLCTLVTLILGFVREPRHVEAFDDGDVVESDAPLLVEP